MVPSEDEVFTDERGDDDGIGFGVKMGLARAGVGFDKPLRGGISDSEALEEAVVVVWGSRRAQRFKALRKISIT